MHQRVTDSATRTSARRGGAPRVGTARALTIDEGAARTRVLREAFTTATLVLASVLALGAVGCTGSKDGDYRGEAPARQSGEATGEATGEVVVPGATATRPESGGVTGTSGSGISGVGDASGSIHTPGQGTVQSGDPSDAAVRSLLDEINASEVEISELGVQKGRSAEVRRYAQAMIAAHRQAPLDRPVEAAGTNSANDLIVPLRDMHQKTLARLQTLPAGPQFDQAFITAQLQKHEGALQALERAETAAKDATLTDRVRRMQTEVERHLAEARRVQGVVSRNTSR